MILRASAVVELFFSCFHSTHILESLDRLATIHKIKTDDQHRLLYFVFLTVFSIFLCVCVCVYTKTSVQSKELIQKKCDARKDVIYTRG